MPPRIRYTEELLVSVPYRHNIRRLSMSDSFGRFLFHAGFLVIAAIQLLAAPPAQGQAQASCTFKLFPLPKPVSLVQVSGVNDFGTVVGSATVAGSTNAKAFIHFAGGGFSYYLPPGSLGSSF